MNLLLLDTAFAAVPIYDYLLRTGNKVFVMGNRAHDVLARRAGARWIEQDYSRVTEVTNHIRGHQIDHIIPGCTDVSINTCIEIQTNPGFVDPPEINHVLSNKQMFRALCADLNLPAPKVHEVSDFPKSGDFICKPVDAYSGRGITVFNGSDLDSLRTACKRAVEASPSATALIERYVAGDLYSCSAFVENQRLTEVFYVLEGSSVNPFAVDTSYVTSVPSCCAATLKTSLEKICSTLMLKDGLLHCQFILSGLCPFIVEVSRRCPGDLYSLLIQYSTGFEYAAKYASYFIDAKYKTQRLHQKNILRHTLKSNQEVIFGGVDFKSPTTIKAFFPLLGLGEALAAGQGTRAGILFSETETPENLAALYRLFMNREVYEVS